MSTTTPEPDYKDIAKRLANAKYGPPEALPVTLVIGGKCLTEEEHEAEFQRRARAMLDRIHRQMSCLVSSTVMDEFLETAADYGIKLTP